MRRCLVLAHNEFGGQIGRFYLSASGPIGEALAGLAEFIRRRYGVCPAGLTIEREG